jgi:hypothetical protein
VLHQNFSTVLDQVNLKIFTVTNLLNLRAGAGVASHCGSGYTPKFMQLWIPNTVTGTLNLKQ